MLENFVIWLIILIIGIIITIPMGIYSFHHRGIIERCFAAIFEKDDSEGIQNEILNHAGMWVFFWVVIGILTIVTGSYLDTISDLVIFFLVAVGFLEAGPFGALGGLILALICDGFINYTGNYVPVTILDYIEKSPMILYHMLF